MGWNWSSDLHMGSTKAPEAIQGHSSRGKLWHRAKTRVKLWQFLSTETDSKNHSNGPGMAWNGSSDLPMGCTKAPEAIQGNFIRG